MAGIRFNRPDEFQNSRVELLERVARRMRRAEAPNDVGHAELDQTRAAIRLGLPLQALAKVAEWVMLFASHIGRTRPSTEW
jgi:hypothetical protein